MPTRTRSRVEIGEENDDIWSVVDYLNVYSYDPASQCYALADGSIGTMIELAPIACTTASDERLTEVAESVALALSGLKEGITGQVIYTPSVDISEEVEQYKRYGGTDHPVIGSIEKRKVEFFDKKRKEPIFTYGDCPFKVKHARVYITLYMRPNEKVGGVFRSLKDSLNMGSSGGTDESGRALTPEEDRFYRYKEKLQRFITTSRRRLMRTLQNQTHDIRVVEPREFISAVRSLMYPISVANIQHNWDPHRPISEQIPVGGINAAPRRGEIETDGVYYRCLSYAQPAEYSEPGRLSLPTRELQYLSFTDYLSYGFITLSFVVQDKDYMRRFFATARKFVEGGMCREPRKPILLNDIDHGENYLENEKRRFFDVQLNVWVYADTQKAAGDEIEGLQDKLTEIGVDARIESYVAPSAFFQSLPFGFGPSLKEAKRTFLVPDRVVADLAPVYSAGRGHVPSKRGIPFQLQNRAGELLNIDFWAGTAPHWFLVGASGSGKSFAANNMFADYLRDPDFQVFIFDKGGSYRTLCNMMGEKGSYNGMGLSQKTCINAFAGTYNVAGAFLKALLVHLACPDPKDGLSAEQLGKLDNILVQCYKEKQIQVPYRWYRDLRAKYPQMWIDTAVKRFEIGYMDTQTLNNVRALSGETEESGPPFRIYYVAALRGQMKVDGKGNRTMVQFTDRDKLADDVYKYLKSRDFRVEMMEDGDGEPFVGLLYQELHAEQNLKMDNFDFVRFEDHMVLELGEEEIFFMLLDNGVSVNMEDEFFDTWEDKIRKEVLADPLYTERARQITEGTDLERAEAEEVINELVDDRVNALSVEHIWEHVEGTATMQQEVFMRNLYEGLVEQRDPDCDAIASRLAPYTGDGNYAGFFDGRTGFALRGKKVTIFELQELASAGPHLLAGVVGALLQMLLLYGQDDDVRGHRKMIALDEFWELLDNPMIAKTIVNLYRTARKFNTSMGVITQSVTDLTRSEAGRSIIQNAPTKLLMRQDKSVCSQLDELLEFSSEEMAVMKTVNTMMGYYSEMMVVCAERGVSEVARLVSTPYFYAIATSNAADVKMRERLRKDYKAQGYDDEEAIDMALTEFSERWPSGVEQGEVKR